MSPDPSQTRPFGPGAAPMDYDTTDGDDIHLMKGATTTCRSIMAAWS